MSKELEGHHYHNCNIFQSGSFNIEFKHVENVNFGNADDIADNAKRIAMQAYESEFEEKLADIINELKPVFLGNVDEVKSFLKAISGASDIQIIAAVNERVQKGIISSMSCNKTLWDILQRHGFYKKGISNWNKMLK